MSCALVERTEVDPRSGRPHARSGQLATSVGGSSPTGAAPRSLDSSEPTADGSNGADQRDRVALAANPQPPGARRVGQPADHPDHRRREDRPGRRLVVERHVAADDRDAERLARPRQTLDRLDQLPGDVRLLGVAEVQAVGQPEWLAPTQARLAAHSSTASAAPRTRIAGDAPPVAVDRDGDRGADRAARARRRRPRSGRRTVRDWTIGSYCSNTGRREAMLADAQQRQQRLVRRLVSGQRRRGGPVRAAQTAARARGRTAGNRRRARDRQIGAPT